MSNPAALVLCSAVLHAGWNLCVKRHPDPNAGMTAIAGISGLFGLAFTLVDGTRPFPGSRALALAVLCGLAESAYFLALGRALRDASLSVAYVVVRGGGVLMVWPLAYLIQREAPTSLQAGAIGLMIAGLALLVPPGGATRSRSGYVWAATAAFFVAVYHVGYKAALAAGGRAWGVFGVAMLIATPATILGMGAPKSGESSSGPFGRAVAAWRTAPLLLLGAGVLSGVSFGLALEAMCTAGAAWVGTLRNASVALAPILGWGVLGERPSGRTLSGFAAVTLAVILLAL